MEKGEWEAEDLHRPNKTKRVERDYTDEALNYIENYLENYDLKPLMNLWRALMSALDTEFKSSRRHLLIVLNLEGVRS